MKPVMDIPALRTFLDRDFPQVAEIFRIEKLTEDGVVIRIIVDESHLRPGGTISGPTMFGLADVAVYLAVLSRIGPKALAVTTSANMDFMRKPAPDRDLVAEARLLKLGRSLAVGDVLIYSKGGEDPVARAAITYSIPPEG